MTFLDYAGYYALLLVTGVAWIMYCVPSGRD